MKDDDDSNLETLFKVRVPESRVTFIRELSILLTFLIGFCAGLFALGLIQYNFVCLERNKTVTFVECLRNDYTWKKK